MAIYRYEADSPYPEALEIGDPALNDFPTTDFAEMDAAEGIWTKEVEFANLLWWLGGVSPKLE